MNLGERLRHSIAAVAFGPREFSQFCNLGLKDPQGEIKVWLTGMGAPRDVTRRNVVAAARPLLIGVGLDDLGNPALLSRNDLTLEFRDGNFGQTLLGTTGLKFIDALELEKGERLCLFRTHSPANYCCSKTLLWRRYLDFAYQQWRNERGPAAPEIRMIASELHALFVFYICPRPVVLVSVVDGESGNLFPMDLIGPIGRHHFSLALHASSKGLPLIEHSRRIALSSVPVEKMPLAHRLGKNHNKERIDWASLPFTLTASSTFALPVPAFSLRVREMEVVTVRNLTSHTLFICKVVDEHCCAEGLQFFQAHGFYEGWRKRAIPAGGTDGTHA
jgi:flavin reductase (DIM6/NTAB) family NADH-FMN oxidoreductase RutF